jgi:hypothetical protein
MSSAASRLALDEWALSALTWLGLKFSTVSL